MKTVKVQIKDGKVDFDFNGFPGRTCENEENAIRALYGRMGVETNVEYSDNKSEAETNGVAEREKVGF